MRQAEIIRKTHETQITVKLRLDGSGTADAATGIGFLDHMLVLLAKHGRLDLVVQAEGDLDTDDHHTAEDVGIVLGQAIARALGDKRGICRYGQAMIPMDEALAVSVIDLSGRSWLVFEADFASDRVGAFSTQMTEEFFRALAFNAGMTLHLTCPYGRNDHHKIEAMFKSFARSFNAAAAIDPQTADEIPSSKGVL
ncbi:MAG: imidazoleglycerol-phosphate dehydratase HisB [Bacillota bacterium]|nr:imidazoleglycerol-phosphate dehydratase HisB [Bacillota bacterium]